MHNYESYNCPHCFSVADTWFDRSSVYLPEDGEIMEYENFPFRCSDCGRNVDAPRSYYGLPDIKFVPFDVYLPGSKVCSQTGKAIDSQFVETVHIPVYENYGEDFLTPKAHLIIGGCKLRALFKRLKAYPIFMKTPHSFLDGLTPEEALQTDDGQRACIVLATNLGLYKSYSSSFPKIKRPLRKL